MFKKINTAQSKHIKKLQRKKNRQTFHEFIVEGTKSFFEFLHSDYICNGIFATEDWLEKNVDKLGNNPFFAINSKQLNQLSTFKNPQPILAIFGILKDTNSEIFPDFILYLDDIRDPGNLGTIIRTAEWFGLQTIYCSETCADAFNFKVIQASMGSKSRVRVVYIPFLDLIKTNPDHHKVLADMEGVSMKKYTWKEKNMLIIGNEANGVSDYIRENVSNKITIEKKGNAESLNASISTAIILSSKF